MTSEWFAYAFVFALGAILGSFVNVLLYRRGTGRSISGRSACATCGETLKARDLVPLVSFLLLRGRCRFCSARISLQYPLVELAAGFLATQSFRLFPDDAFLFSFALLVSLLLLFVAVYDIRHTIIPDTCSLALGALALGSLFFRGFDLPTFLAGPALAAPLFAFAFFSKGRAMGLGDPKLMVGLGWLLGPLKGFTALLSSFWIGLATSLLLLLIPLSSRRGHLTMKSEIPYAPFLIMGAFLAYFTDAADLVARVLFS